MRRVDSDVLAVTVDSRQGCTQHFMPAGMDVMFDMNPLLALIL